MNELDHSKTLPQFDEIFKGTRLETHFSVDNNDAVLHLMTQGQGQNITFRMGYVAKVGLQIKIELNDLLLSAQPSLLFEGSFNDFRDCLEKGHALEETKAFLRIQDEIAPSNEQMPAIEVIRNVLRN